MGNKLTGRLGFQSAVYQPSAVPLPLSAGPTTSPRIGTVFGEMFSFINSVQPLTANAGRKLVYLDLKPIINRTICNTQRVWKV